SRGVNCACWIWVVGARQKSFAQWPRRRLCNRHLLEPRGDNLLHPSSSSGGETKDLAGRVTRIRSASRMNPIIQYTWRGQSLLAVARARRSICLPAIFFLSIAPMAYAEALSEADVKNLLARIRENRITQADFQEQRVIRLMKKPIVNSGKVWFQPPNNFRRDAKGSYPCLTF